MKIILIKSFAFIFLILACVFIYAHFSDLYIDIEAFGEQSTVLFKPRYAFEYAIISVLLAIALYIILFILRLNTNKNNDKNLDIEEEILSPDEYWSRYLLSSLQEIYSYEKDKIINYFEELGKSFQVYKLHHTEEISEFVIKVELRGQFKDYPVKIGFSALKELKLYVKADIFPRFLEIYKNSGLFSAEKAKSTSADYLETYISNYARIYEPILKLYYDPKKIPVHKDINDPWSKDDKLRIFFANGIYIEEYEEYANVQMAVYQSFSKEFRDNLADNISRNQIASIVIFHDEIVISFLSESVLNKPLTSISEGLNLLTKIAGEFETVSFTGDLKLNSNIDKSSKMVRLVTCNYCTSKFPLVDECSCPNCGASFY